MPWPKGKPIPRSAVDKRVRTYKANGKRRKKPRLIEGVEHWLCPTCGQWLPTERFYASKKTATGLTSQCRACHVDTSIRTRDAEHARETNREHMARAVRRDPDKFRRRWREYGQGRQRTDRDRARTILNAAVRRGQITRPRRCEECGAADRRIDGHHDDYSKPLEVRWLCTRCHGREHRTEVPS